MYTKLENSGLPCYGWQRTSVLLTASMLGVDVDDVLASMLTTFWCCQCIMETPRTQQIGKSPTVSHVSSHSFSILHCLTSIGAYIHIFSITVSTWICMLWHVYQFMNPRRPSSIHWVSSNVSCQWWGSPSLMAIPHQNSDAATPNQPFTPAKFSSDQSSPYIPALNFPDVSRSLHDGCMPSHHSHHSFWYSSTVSASSFGMAPHIQPWPTHLLSSCGRPLMLRPFWGLSNFFSSSDTHFHRKSLYLSLSDSFANAS